MYSNCNLFPLDPNKVLDTESLCAVIQRIMKQAEDLLPKIEDVKIEQIGDLVDQEMQHTTNAIEEAAARIAVCLQYLLCSFHIPDIYMQF